MSADLKDLMNHKVSVITNDGRHVIGVLKGFDKATNLVLTDSQERVYSEDSAMETVDLGFFLLRGDNCALVGLLNTAKDASTDWSTTFALPIKPIVH